MRKEVKEALDVAGFGLFAVSSFAMQASDNPFVKGAAVTYVGGVIMKPAIEAVGQEVKKTGKKVIEVYRSKKESS